MKKLSKIVHPVLLCSTPALVGFVLGILSIKWPAMFLTLLVGVMLLVAFLALKSYMKSGELSVPTHHCHVEVAAGVILGCAFMMAFWGALAVTADLGVFKIAFVLAFGLSCLAALTLTVGKDLVYGNVRWANELMGWITQRVLPGQNVRR